MKPKIKRSEINIIKTEKQREENEKVEKPKRTKNLVNNSKC